MNSQTGDLNVGDTAPSFCLPDKDNRETCLTDFNGIGVVLYFYPQNNTNKLIAIVIPLYIFHALNERCKEK